MNIQALVLLSLRKTPSTLESEALRLGALAAEVRCWS